MELTIKRAEVLIEYYEKEIEYQKEKIKELEICLEMYREELKKIKGENNEKIEDN